MSFGGDETLGVVSGSASLDSDSIPAKEELYSSMIIVLSGLVYRDVTDGGGLIIDNQMSNQTVYQQMQAEYRKKCKELFPRLQKGEFTVSGLMEELFKFVLNQLRTHSVRRIRGSEADFLEEVTHSYLSLMRSNGMNADPRIGIVAVVKPK